MSDIFMKELKKALENVSGKSLSDKYCSCGEMLHDFNISYKTCKVRLNVFNASTNSNINNSSTLVVKQGDTTQTIDAQGYYVLPIGNYTYTCSSSGFDTKTNVAFEVTELNCDNGTMSITIKLTPTVVDDGE